MKNWVIVFCAATLVMAITALLFSIDAKAELINVSDKAYWFKVFGNPCAYYGTTVVQFMIAGAFLGGCDLFWY